MKLIVTFHFCISRLAIILCFVELTILSSKFFVNVFKSFCEHFLKRVSQVFRDCVIFLLKIAAYVSFENPERTVEPVESFSRNFADVIFDESNVEVATF